MVQQTSIQAFNSINHTIGTRKKQVLTYIKTVGKTYNRQISAALNLPINSITPRVLELRQEGRIRFAGHTIDVSTGKRVMLWE